MPTIETTIEFIKRAHAGQTDKIGVDYYLHPVAVMDNLPSGVSEDVKLAALLHDVIEDTEYTRNDLQEMGYSKFTLDIVDLVTKKPEGETSYINKIRSIIDSGNEGAILVKYADMRENTKPERLAKVGREVQARLKERYSIPIAMLTEAVKRLGYEVSEPSITSIR